MNSDKLLYWVSDEAHKECAVSYCLKMFLKEGKALLSACKNISGNYSLNCFPELYKLKLAAMDFNGEAAFQALKEVCAHCDIKHGPLLFNILLLLEEYCYAY